MKVASYTKKGPGITSFNKSGDYHIRSKSAKVSHRKLRKQASESKVGLKNKNVSLVDLYFAEKRIDKLMG